MKNSPLDRFLTDQDRELEELAKAVSGPLDVSYESLDRVEDYYTTVLELNPEKKQLQLVQSRIARYLGQTLVEHAGGAWVMTKEPNGMEPTVRVPQVATQTFNPLGAVWDFKRLRKPGLLRDRTEEWDLTLRGAELARLGVARDAELAALRTDLEQLTGTTVTQLDGSPACLEVVEQALRAVARPGIARARRRDVHGRVELLLGTLFADAVGGGSWTVVEDPENADFGHFKFAGWAPNRLVRSTSATAESGRLLHAFTRETTARTKAGSR